MKRLTTILFFGLLLHILVSFIFILSPSYLERLRASKAYKTYLLPGPFFSAEKIADTYSLSVKWRVNNQWVDGGNPVREEFKGYHRNLNVSVLYLNRLNRAQFQSLLVEDSVSSIGVKQNSDFENLTQKMVQQHVPSDADSIYFIFTRKRAKNFEVNRDTIQLLIRP